MIASVPAPLHTVPEVLSIIAAGLQESSSGEAARQEFMVVLMKLCGPALLGCDWFLAYLTSSGDNPHTHIVVSALGRATRFAVVACDAAMNFINAALFGEEDFTGEKAAQAITTLCRDAVFRNDARVCDWLNTNVLVRPGFDGRHTGCFDGFLAGGVSVLVSPDPTGIIAGLLNSIFCDESYQFGDLFDLLYPGAPALQPFVFDFRILPYVSAKQPVSIHGATLCIETPAGHYEHLLTVDDTLSLFSSTMHLPRFAIACSGTCTALVSAGALPPGHDVAIALVHLALLWHGEEESDDLLLASIAALEALGGDGVQPDSMSVHWIPVFNRYFTGFKDIEGISVATIAMRALGRLLQENHISPCDPAYIELLTGMDRQLPPLRPGYMPRHEDFNNNLRLLWSAMDATFSCMFTEAGDPLPRVKHDTNTEACAIM